MKRAVFLLAGMMLFASAGPAAADEVLNFCGNKTTAEVRAITTVGERCSSTEWSLGPTVISHGIKRPKKLNGLFLNRVKTARVAARKAGYKLIITSGWRSMAQQRILFKRSIKRNGPKQVWVLPPNLSNHPWGLAVDINYKSGKRKGAKWLQTNGYKWGLCRAYQNEWWHFEPLTAPGTPCPAPAAYPKWF